MCDIAILVVDITSGLKPQTIESINLLRSRKCPFVVALNKVGTNLYRERSLIDCRLHRWIEFILGKLAKMLQLKRRLQNKIKTSSRQIFNEHIYNFNLIIIIFRMEFDSKVQFVVNQLAEQGLNSTLYYKNKDFKKYVSIVPTSAVSGEGIYIYLHM